MKAGFYETEVTPPLGSGIPGYFGPRWANGVKQKLYAKAAVIDNGKNTVAFLVIDVLDLPIGLPQIVRERVSKETGIDKNAILIAATHSHTALPVRCDEFKDSDTVKDQKIIETTALLAADAVILAYKQMKPCKISFSMGVAEGVSFIRQYYLKDGSVRTNPGYCQEEVDRHYGEPDTEFPIFFITDEEDNPLGAITSFALHHDTVTGEEYSSDYSGLVSKHLKNTYGLDFVTVFFAGFCGDINHLEFCNTDDDITTAEIAEVLAREFVVAADNRELLADDSLEVKMETVTVGKRKVEKEFIDSVKYLVENPPGPGDMTIADPYSDRMKYAASRTVLEWHDIDKRTEFDVPVQVIKLGDCLVYALVGEEFSHFAHKIRAVSPTEKNMCVSMAHSDDYRCYIPTKELFSPLVYESTIYSALLEPDAGDKMSDKAIEMAKAIY